MKDIENMVRKGTTTVGIVCRDGLVLAADRRATMGNLIADKKAQKIYAITDKMALTTAGNASDAQLLVKLVKAEISLKRLRTERAPNVKEAANLLGGMIYANIRRMSMIPGISHFLLGGIDDDGFHMYDLFVDGSVTLCDDYVSSGSGSVMAFGVLETLYKKDISVKEGVPLAVKSINAALQRDIYTGSGIDVVTITKEGVKTVIEKEFDTSIKI